MPSAIHLQPDQSNAGWMSKHCLRYWGTRILPSPWTDTPILCWSTKSTWWIASGSCYKKCVDYHNRCTGRGTLYIENIKREQNNCKTGQDVSLRIDFALYYGIMIVTKVRQLWYSVYGCCGNLIIKNNLHIKPIGIGERQWKGVYQPQDVFYSSYAHCVCCALPSRYWHRAVRIQNLLPIRMILAHMSMTLLITGSNVPVAPKSRTKPHTLTWTGIVRCAGANSRRNRTRTVFRMPGHTT